MEEALKKSLDKMYLAMRAYNIGRYQTVDDLIEDLIPLTEETLDCLKAEKKEQGSIE